MKTTVIIPSYNRPEFLQEAIKSVWAQTCLPDEIIIGDDSNNDDTERLVNETLIEKSPVPIKYFHHKPALKQTKNVDFLMMEASFDFLLLLHDDDLLMPNCIELLKEPLIKHPKVVASFGNQYLIKEDGSIIKDSDKHLNEKYYRTPNRAGFVNGQWAASVQMLPNNAFLMRTKEAQQIRYYDEGRAGDAVDFYFGFRLGKDRLFFWVNEVTSKYRVGQPSITGSGSVEFMSCIVKILFEDLPPKKLKSLAINKKIRDLMNPAISEVIRGGDKKTAIKWIFSSYYNVLTFRGFKRLLMIINPF
ncbi:glycosyltransferase family 2 protein [Gillisia limnaea]|uniref:Glycosyl transferase family 2 n=1 Tax=Gillisia limnaea (strain DSM 15749 / LMG 21470 / R-8282) TaxID=865937 RepID=H2BT64_GILLR|nr:glycosyltransferase family 2 protein [Gillisia limnaea]EHQ02622.1 glycosyl transferase family 2 [Gillisia limnaea DSM 15749]